MRFTKMHGAGNDYVYVDLFDERVEDAPAVAIAVSDRHKGIGADGLILLGPSEVADVRMVMYNADGSRSGMCGNGLRCLARLARDRGRAKGDVVRIETDVGVRTVALTAGGARADMGAPVLEPARVPVRLPGARVVDEALLVDGRTLRITCLSMGNPHAVVFVDDVRRFDVARFGPALERHEVFPDRVNASFVQVVDRTRVRQRTWERGAGETLACGSGACAVCVAGVLTGRTDRRIASELPGGELLLEWAESVFLAGETVTVFAGNWGGGGGHGV
ncbi:MAG TPA: diaminopimelate epimerase [Planctomycetota bacterium]|nr:diaminopimelate epimerase [Planctomycetota bacterium]